MTHLLGAHLHNPSHSCGAGKANKTAVTQAWRVLGTQGEGSWSFKLLVTQGRKSSAYMPFTAFDDKMVCGLAIV